MHSTRWWIRALQPVAALYVALAEFYNSHIEGEQPWKVWQRWGN